MRTTKKVTTAGTKPSPEQLKEIRERIEKAKRQVVLHDAIKDGFEKIGVAISRPVGV
jgi:hypothetical protein